MDCDVQIVMECENCKEEVPIESFDDNLDICNVCKCKNRLENVSISGEIIILSIDIGIQPLGMVLSSVNEKYEFQKILWMDLVDITIFRCHPKCNLHHDKTFADWVLHVIEYYKDIFEKATFILIERQPPQGLVVIEQILFGCWRDKSILISPNSVHKFFKIGQLDYEQRKIASVNISKKYLSQTFENQLQTCHRKHDICDAILFTIFWTTKEKEKKEIEILHKKRKDAFDKVNNKLGMSLNDFFDMYRYIPSILN
jgi:hypothetical protein